MTHAHRPTVPGKVLQRTPTLDCQNDLLLLQLCQCCLTVAVLGFVTRTSMVTVTMTDIVQKPVTSAL